MKKLANGGLLFVFDDESNQRIRVTEDVFVDGWEFTLGRRKSFYLRGATWFRRTVHPDPTTLSQFADTYAEVMKGKTSWSAVNCDWGRFAFRQANPILSLDNREPALFVRALQTLALCEAAATHKIRANGVDRGYTTADVYGNMLVEPAVFYIIGFDEELWNEIKERDRNIVTRLGGATKQPRRFVFDDMARGHTVTRRLAEGVRALLAAECKDITLGEVQFAPYKGMKPASTFETLT